MQRWVDIQSGKASLTQFVRNTNFNAAYFPTDGDRIHIVPAPVDPGFDSINCPTNVVFRACVTVALPNPCLVFSLKDVMKFYTDPGDSSIPNNFSFAVFTSNNVSYHP